MGFGAIEVFRVFTSASANTAGGSPPSCAAPARGACACGTHGAVVTAREAAPGWRGSTRGRGPWQMSGARSEFCASRSITGPADQDAFLCSYPRRLCLYIRNRCNTKSRRFRTCRERTLHLCVGNVRKSRGAKIYSELINLDHRSWRARRRASPRPDVRRTLYSMAVLMHARCAHAASDSAAFASSKPRSPPAGGGSSVGNSDSSAAVGSAGVVAPPPPPPPASQPSHRRASAADSRSRVRWPTPPLRRPASSSTLSAYS